MLTDDPYCRAPTTHAWSSQIRKLEFILADALIKGHDCVVTIGGALLVHLGLMLCCCHLRHRHMLAHAAGPQSNHNRATAVAARSAQQVGVHASSVLAA